MSRLYDYQPNDKLFRLMYLKAFPNDKMNHIYDLYFFHRGPILVDPVSIHSSSKSLPNDKILELSKFKTYAEDKCDSNFPKIFSKGLFLKGR